MKLNSGIGDQAIQDVIKGYPEIGTLLESFDIGCVSCKVGICLLKDVVSIHGLAREDEMRIEREINELIANKGE